MLKRCLAAAGLVVLLLPSCGEEPMYDQYQVVEQTIWYQDKTYYFTFYVTDTEHPYDVYLRLRNNNRYPYQNLWIFATEEKPAGGATRDTLECMLADDFGKWLGHGISLYQSSFPLRQRYYFPHKGQYTFAIRQGMRGEKVEGVQEVGVTVERSKED